MTSFLPPLPGEGKNVLDHASEADLKHRLKMIHAVAKSVIKAPQRGALKAEPKKAYLGPSANSWWQSLTAS